MIFLSSSGLFVDPAVTLKANIDHCKSMGYATFSTCSGQCTNDPMGGCGNATQNVTTDWTPKGILLGAGVLVAGVLAFSLIGKAAR